MTVPTSPPSTTAIASPQGLRLGLDVGTLFVHGVLLDSLDHVVARGARPHQGEVLNATRHMLAEWINGVPISAAAVVGDQARSVARALGLDVGDHVGATLRGLRVQIPAVRQVIDAGGSSLSLIRLNENGSFASYETNTLCAAGTGSFLDEQAERLGLGYGEIAELPSGDAPPDVAARCAVFAKSDLIHLQQEGYDRTQCWVGLCRGLARTMVATLFRGRTAEPPVALVGGVALNPEVVRGLRAELGIDPVLPEHPQSCTALGAALSAEPLPADLDLALLSQPPQSGRKKVRRPPLRLQRSRYPAFEVSDSRVDRHGTEVRISAWPAGRRLSGWLGIDVGSTSTKAVLVGDDNQVILDLYRRTAGDPIGAARLLLQAIGDLVRERGVTVEICGMGTTGSGRKLVGTLFGADRVCNEITAHLTGAVQLDSSIDTIFEIGGQDAKYIHVVEGRLHDTNMNHVCAAGTGSFVEELSRKLGFDLDSLGDQLLEVEPPVTSNRCTVFMEQDARHLLRQGFSPREVMAGVVCSVVENYLAEVVGHRPRPRERVFFQGATARNKALVAAFEQILDVEVIVSDFCHVMGAWGVAILTRQHLESTGASTGFQCLDLADRKIRVHTSTCTQCANRCTITTAGVEGLEASPSWGYLCDRDPEEARVKGNPAFAAFRARNRLWRAVGLVRLPADAPEIALPRALLTWQYAPFWRRFFGELGYRLRLSGPTDEATVRGASDWVGADYCFPVKLAHGHARKLLEAPPPIGVAGTETPVLLPFMISDREGTQDGCTTRAWFCPYNIGLPAMLEAAARLRGQDVTRLLKVTLDLRWDDATAARRLQRDLYPVLDRSRQEIRRAWRAAREALRYFEDGLQAQGRTWLSRIRDSGEPAVVVMGRPYNVMDVGVNLALPEKLSRLGFTMLPMDILPLEQERLGDEFANMYWSFGRRLIAAAQYIARTPELYAFGLTNFGCGPDSFVWTYVEKVMAEKPMLLLELDEHSVDAGYLTRLEAFADVLRQNPVNTAPPFRLHTFTAKTMPRNELTLWIPPMHEAIPSLTAAALRREGIAARALPGEDVQAFRKGRLHTRGGECVPCPATLGSFLATVQREGGGPSRHGLFMPTAEGPCRFGQYCTLDRIILEELGWDPVHILSWSSTNTYAGLSPAGRRRFWTALVLGDLLFKMRCRVAPYETEFGLADDRFNTWTARLAQAIEAGERLEPLVAQARKAFMGIPRRGEQRPLVGIVGEIYVRHNRFANQDLVRVLEENGGEAWLTPITEWVLYIGYLDSQGLGNSIRGKKARLAARFRNSFLARVERHWMKLASPLLDNRHEPLIERVLKEGSRFVPLDFVGETILTLGRATVFAQDGASMVVNCAPFGCMPGAMTAGVLRHVETETGVPVASLVYDGEHEGVNDRLATYLANLRERKAAPNHHPW